MENVMRRLPQMKYIASTRQVLPGWIITCSMLSLLAAADVSHAADGTNLARGAKVRVSSQNGPLTSSHPAMPASLKDGLVCHLSFEKVPPPATAEAPVSGMDLTRTVRYVLSGGEQTVVNGAFRPHVDHDLVLPHVPAL